MIVCAGKGPPAIEVQGVDCSRKGKQILKDVTLTVPKGTVLGLLGPNGAGKTTLIRLIAGLAWPDAGRIRVAGEDASRRSVAFRRRIGLVPQENTLESELTVGGSLLAYARLYGVAHPKVRVREAARKYHLTGFLARRPEEISGGMRRRAVIARAAMTDSDVLLLDEPSVGLDPDLRQEIWALVRTLQRAGKTILLTTHYMEEAETLCGRIAFLREGRLLLVDTADGIRRRAGADSLEQAFLRLSREEEEA